MDLIFGLENEYGVLVEDCMLIELPCAVKAIVESCDLQACHKWDYMHESPRMDMRGFVVKQLETDPREEALDRETIKMAPNAFEPCDRILQNGARLYHDHAHPEYSTPECRTIKDLVAHDKAGERIILRCARNFSARYGLNVRVFKNNTDFHGSSYGTHENYLMLRSVPFEAVVDALIPFLCTRIIYAGAGKVGGETDVSKGIRYQLSQRAEHFDTVLGVDTQCRRPILNTRDEPHADRSAYRRLHVIVGDANMSQYATALKVGTTALTVKLLEMGWRVPSWLRLSNPVKALHKISTDEDMKWLVELLDGRTVRAIDIQRVYLAAAQELFLGADEDVKWVLKEWSNVLDGLEIDPMSLSSRLDWVAKKRLMEMFIDSERTDWDDERLRAIDLEYHNVDVGEGLYYALEAKGLMERIVEENDIEAAIFNPPQNTRALIRGCLIRRFNSLLACISWGVVKVNVNGSESSVDLRHLVGDEVSYISDKLVSESLTIYELIELCELLERQHSMESKED